MVNSNKQQEVHIAVNAEKIKNFIDLLTQRLESKTKMKTKYSKGYRQALIDISEEIDKNPQNYILSENLS